MRIGEIAQRAGVSTSRLRFYEAEGLLPPVGRDANGYRAYDVRTVKIVGIIEQAQNLGFSLKEISAFLALPHEQLAKPETIISLLQGKLREIDAHIREVQKRRREVKELLQEYGAEQKARVGFQTEIPDTCSVKLTTKKTNVGRKSV
jgi:MerR family transcriptional regulator, copper efflux regulator